MSACPLIDFLHLVTIIHLSSWFPRVVKELRFLCFQLLQLLPEPTNVDHFASELLPGLFVDGHMDLSIRP